MFAMEKEGVLLSLLVRFFSPGSGFICINSSSDIRLIFGSLSNDNGIENVT